MCLWICFSLPTQRCFWLSELSRPPVPLFSAYAEVFLHLERFHPQIQRFSLPTQRCFSDHVLAAWKRSAFLCLRRGVSLGLTGPAQSGSFSLPTQRCFWLSRFRCPAQSLFSAYAEVFQNSLISKSMSVAFLCLRRGVSKDIW